MLSKRLGQKLANDGTDHSQMVCRHAGGNCYCEHLKIAGGSVFIGVSTVATFTNELTIPGQSARSLLV